MINLDRIVGFLIGVLLVLAIMFGVKQNARITLIENNFTALVRALQQPQQQPAKVSNEPTGK